MANKNQQIQEVLDRGVENIYPNKAALEKALRAGKKLKIYNGIDPTGALHIGHGVVLLKLRQLQALGHEIVILIGDFTAQIGDPTDKKATRKPLTKSQVEANARSYKKQIAKVLNVGKSKVKFLHNDEWTNKLKPIDLLELASHFTVSRLLERDMFQERIKAGKEIHLHEFMYPIFQAYDAVTMDVDMQVGGNDQTYNMLAGRTLMKKLKQKEKFVLTTKLLVDPQGAKMGKTTGNMINLDESPEEMFGKVMSWPDELIMPAFEIATQVPFAQLTDLQKQLKSGTNPKELKMILAGEIVSLWHSQKAAEDAAKKFSQLFEKKQQPTDMTEVKVKSRIIIDVLVETNLAGSKSEARRLIEQKGVRIDGQIASDQQLTVESGSVIQKGKRHFIKIK